jgi:uncharacterized repeat protein (TIGR01451 family)
MRHRYRRSAGWPLPAILRRRRAGGVNSGRRVRAVVIATALVGSGLSAVALSPVASASPALHALPAPIVSQYPATWTVSGNVATGTTPDGVVVTATVTGPAKFFVEQTGSLVLNGPTPGYIPVTTTEALLLQVTDCTVAPCGSITYSFSRPVFAPVLYLGDVGDGSIDDGIFLSYHDSPVTLASGTFSLAADGSETANMSIQNAGTTVGITDPGSYLDQPITTVPYSCVSYGCGAYDITTTTPTVTSVTVSYGYAGTGISEDVFSQILAITPTEPALTLTKSVSPLVAAGAGATVTYSYLITNTGNVTLTDVHPQDTAFSGTGTPSAIACPPPPPPPPIPSSGVNARPAAPPSSVLAPGQSETCVGTYTLTQADADAGQVTNTATATGTPPSGPAVTSAPSSATVTIPGHPVIVVIKTASPRSLSRAGDTVRYHYLVTNSGNVTLTGVKINDLLPGLSAIACPSATLSPAGSMTCTASYRLTQANVNAGKVTNTATTTGTPPSGPPVISAPSSVTVTIPPSPALVIKESASPASFDAAGVTIDYSYLVTNTGNGTVRGSKINDVLAGLSAIACPSATLNPGKHMTCTATYVTTKANVNAGKVTNTATITGDPPTGSPVVSGPSTVVIATAAPVHRGTPVPVTG